MHANPKHVKSNPFIEAHVCVRCVGGCSHVEQGERVCTSHLPGPHRSVEKQVSLWENRRRKHSLQAIVVDHSLGCLSKARRGLCVTASHSQWTHNEREKIDCTARGAGLLTITSPSARYVIVQGRLQSLIQPSAAPFPLSTTSAQ